MLRSIDLVLDAALDGWCTAVVARVEHCGKLIYERAMGATRDDETARRIYLDTRFDLASVGKLFIATLALDAVDQEKLSLDTPLSEIISEWRGNEHQPITLRMLLTHTAGLNSGADYRELLGTNIVEFALGRSLVAVPGEQVIYSDLGFIALGAILERVYERSLPSLVRDFGRPTLGYSPRRQDRPWIPATECDAWRGRVQGCVHDEKAYLMGGVAGHAGLFGTAADVAWLARKYLQPSGLMIDAVTEQAWDPILRRGLGWALKTRDDNSCGAAFSRESFGHTGFVGTCVWADPRRDLIGVFLTNAVYYGRRDTRDLRVAFYDAIAAVADQR